MIRFIRRIIHVIKWLPIIWNDSEWDSYYIFKILRFKLYNMGKHFHNNGHCINHKEVAHEMKTCIHLLDRIMEDGYDLEAFDLIEKKWGKINNIWEYRDKYTLLKYSYRDKVFSKKDDEQCHKHSLREYKRAEDRRNYDIYYLFHILNRKILTWWD